MGILLSASSAGPEPSLHSSHFFAELQISTSSLQFLKYPWHQLDFISFEGKKMEVEEQEEKLQFSLQVSTILRFIVKKPLNDPKAPSPRVWGVFGEHLALFLKMRDLAVEVQLTCLSAHWQINSRVKGNCGVKGNPPVPNYRCWRQ